MAHTFFLIVSLLIPIVAFLALLKIFLGRNVKPDLTIDNEELAKAEAELRDSENKDWVVLKRCHGPAYNHAAMTEIISALNAVGVEATYDVMSSSSAEGGITNYMLKVIRGQEVAAKEVLTSLGHTV